MTPAEFESLVSTRWQRQADVLVGKCGVYSRGGDRLSNFKDGAASRKITPQQYLLTLVTKHWVAINDMVDSGETPGQDWINEYLGDVINYMLLLEGLYADLHRSPDASN